MIEERLIALVTEALAEVARELGLEGDLPEVELTKPRQKEHGDFATNVALVLAPRVGRSPRDVAELLLRHLPDALVRPVGRGGRPGIHQLPAHDGLAHRRAPADVAARGEAYGRADPNGRRAQVEFVSANPTGPLHIGHARNAALGDALARVLEAAGWSVEREYYFNDTGGQMDRFGASVEARYLQLLGREAEVPEDGYHGDYVIDLARRILGRKVRAWPTCHPRSGSRGSSTRPPGWCSSRSTGRSSGSGCASTASCTNGAGGEGSDRRGRSAPAGRRVRVRRRGGGLVPLDRVRRRQGSAARAIERDAHVLRRRLRVPDRQVRARVRPPRCTCGAPITTATSPGYAGPRRRSGTTPSGSRS